MMSDKKYSLPFFWIALVAVLSACLFMRCKELKTLKAENDAIKKDAEIFGYATSERDLNGNKAFKWKEKAEKTDTLR